VPQNSLQSIVPDLATSWSWSEDGAQLAFQLRDDVKWHDGRPFTAKDVQCTWDLPFGKVWRVNLSKKRRQIRSFDQRQIGSASQVTAPKLGRNSEISYGEAKPEPEGLGGAG
jgi:ABC-type transport system substrate-binding protein